MLYAIYIKIHIIIIIIILFRLKKITISTISNTKFGQSKRTA